MLEDSYVGIYDLERVSFHFKAITGEVGDVEPNGAFMGDRSSVEQLSLFRTIINQSINYEIISLILQL